MQPTVPTTAAGGMNQMLELFKMQYLMKFLEGGQGTNRGTASLLTMLVLMGYDQFAKYVPVLVQLIWTWFHVQIYGKPTQNGSRTEALMAAGPPPPAQKSVRAFIQFERNAESRTADPRIDAVIHHVCNLPEVRSLRYNGVEMIPNFKDILMIENDIWFEIINPTSAPMINISGSTQSSQRLEPILYRLSTYDHDITWLHKFVEQAIDRFEQEKRNKLGSETYYFDMVTGSGGAFRNPVPQGFCIFNKSKFTSNRSLSNVYLRQIGELESRVHFFMRRRDWYDSKGIPHTLGIVMYGAPGCGKTSTIKAIANETKRHIFNIMLSEIKTKDALKDLFYNDQIHVYTEGKTEVLNIPLKQRLFVIEDIDAMNSVVIKRSQEEIKKEQERKLRIEAEMELLKQTQGDTLARNMMKGKEDADADKLDLATMLNVLDGVRETPGRIIILSTNYPERLDEALLRPGRFDMMIEFEKHNGDVLQQHLEKHYDVALTAAQSAFIHRPDLDKKWTPAEVSQILFRRVSDIDGAIQDLVHEDPRKLFKFSQIGGGTNQPVQLTGQEPETQGQQSELQPEPQSTDLNDLLSVEEAKESSQPSSDTEEDDDIVLFSGGGITAGLDRPTTEQLAAATEVSKTLFAPQTQMLKEYENELVALEKDDPRIEFWRQDLSPEQKEAAQAYNAKREAIQKDLQAKQLALMMSSPMFQDADEDGIKAMGNEGLTLIQCDTDSGEKITHFAAANVGAEPTLDDYFPPPLEDFKV